LLTRGKTQWFVPVKLMMASVYNRHLNGTGFIVSILSDTPYDCCNNGIVSCKAAIYTIQHILQQLQYRSLTNDDLPPCPLIKNLDLPTAYHLPPMQ